MLEHMKKPPIEKVTLSVKGPIQNQQKAVELLQKLDFYVEDESIPWRDAFKEFRDNDSGSCLAGGRHKEGLTQNQLSKMTGIPQRHISEMENGKRSIGKKTALLLGDALNIDYRIFL